MKDVVDHLTNLVRIPSVSSLSNRPVIDYAAEALHDAHWQTLLVPYLDAKGIEKINLIAAPPGQNIENPASELAFVCHTDTVPYASDWAKATDPFVADGLLYGCGACDVKGFLACLLTAISQIAPSRLINGLRLALTADEEIGCIGANQLIGSGLLRPRRVIAGEPTSLHPARAGKGYCLAEITVFGEEAHSALPQKGKSAIYRAARLITAIEEFGSRLSEQQHHFFSPSFTTLNIGTIQGGTAKNIIPGQCSFQLEWRPIPGQPADTVPTAVSRLVEKLRKTDPAFRWKLSLTRQQRGFETPQNSPLVRTIEALAARPATSIPFASEASLFADVAEEALVFGPGDMQTAHSNRECVPADQLQVTVHILQSLMTSMPV
jgi:acetylornithine deacetylase